MRIRAILISSALVVTAAVGTASSASGATLFTDTSRTTPVAVGTTANATNRVPVVLTSATSVINTCNNSTLNLTLDQNSGGTVVGTVTAGSFTNCHPLPATGIYTAPWKLSIHGAATATGDVTRWNAQVTGVGFLLGGGTYHGNLTTGVTAEQTEGGMACLDFNDAGQLTGPLTANGRIDTTYCFEGAAAAYSLG
jgi:hypothetical protein